MDINFQAFRKLVMRVRQTGASRLEKIAPETNQVSGNSQTWLDSLQAGRKPAQTSLLTGHTVLKKTCFLS